MTLKYLVEASDVRALLELLQHVIDSEGRVTDLFLEQARGTVDKIAAQMKNENEFVGKAERPLTELDAVQKFIGGLYGCEDDS